MTIVSEMQNVALKENNDIETQTDEIINETVNEVKSKYDEIVNGLKNTIMEWTHKYETLTK